PSKKMSNLKKKFPFPILYHSREMEYKEGIFMNELTSMYQQQNNNGGVVAQSQASREMEEVKGQIFMARQFPRNVFQSEQRILDACKRPELAQSAVYSYPRGKQVVEGPSIRLAEVLA